MDAVDGELAPRFIHGGADALENSRHTGPQWERWAELVGKSFVFSYVSRGTLYFIYVCIET